MAGRQIATKLTTGLTGLEVAANPHEKLRILYEKTLKVLARMPKEATYRASTEEIVHSRLQQVNQHKSVDKLEQSINCGQIEEVIVQAQNELSLARKMVDWKPWEPLVKAAPSNQWKWPI